MKTSVLFLLVASLALLSPTALAAPSKKLKGAKQSSRKESSTTPGMEHRKLHEGHDFKKAKKILHGPSARTCTYTAKTGANGRSKHRELKQQNYYDVPESKQSNSGRSSDGSKASVNKQEVKFTCQSNSNTNAQGLSRGITLDPAEIRDKIQYKVKTDKKGIQVKVEYKSEFEEAYGVDEYTDTQTTFEVLFESLVEYAKLDGATNYYTSGFSSPVVRTDEEQAYDWQDDVIVQTKPFEAWGNMTNVTDSADGVMSSFSVASADGIANFTFSISRADIGESVTANTMKIDVRISNFPWLRQDTNLALMSTVKSKLKVEMSYNTDASVSYDRNGNIERKTSKMTEKAYVSFDEAAQEVGFVPFGDYSWDDAAEATHSNRPAAALDLCNPSLLERARTMGAANASLPPGCLMNATVTEAPYAIVEEKGGIRVVGTSPPASLVGNETHQHIAYSFVGNGSQHAEEIYWDPKAGIGYSEAQEESSALGTVLSRWGLGVSFLVTGVLNAV